MRALRNLFVLLAAMAVLTAGAAAAAVCYLDAKGIAPRALASYLARHGSADAAPLAQALLRLDRGEAPLLDRAADNSGATASAIASEGRVRPVSSAEQVRSAIADARPGDAITLAPGRYRFQGAGIEVTRPGAASERISVRAEAPGTVFLEFDLLEGFIVSAPYWSFENLSIGGVCGDHSNCEHAFHVVDGAHDFVAVNNTISDFNAHFKINGSGGSFPDHGFIEGNTLRNSGARKTANPVSVIDLVAASDWIVRRNLISDFVKQGGDGISYGGFAKGAGARNVFEHNVVWCERALRGAAGQRVGLSLGDGGTGKPYCRDKACITEQDGGIIRDNLIVSCSDDGIYLNSAARSIITNNTLIDTGGVLVRYASSSADVQGNVVDGAIRASEGAIVRASGNRETPIMQLYLGRHPLR